MAEKRLSRLQRWILTEALKKGRRNLDGPFGDWPNWEADMIKHGLGYLVNRHWIGTREIHRHFYRLPAGAGVPEKQSVSVSRSLTTLEKRGYVKRYRHSLCYVGGKVALTELGVRIAKGIIDTEREPLIQ